LCRRATIVAAVEGPSDLIRSLVQDYANDAAVSTEHGVGAARRLHFPFARYKRNANPDS
jgi:hypothetical protein